MEWIKKVLLIILIVFVIQIVVTFLLAMFVTDKEKWFTPGFFIAVFIIILATGIPFRILRWFRSRR